jgi:phage protein D
MSNYLDIQFPTLDTQLTRAAEFTHKHARYEHEMVDIYFGDWGMPYESIVTGTPVIVTMKGAGSTRTMNGYIHHVSPDISPDKNYVQVTVIGSSYVFKQQSQKVWFEATADQVVSDIASSKGFSYIATPSERVYDQISQAGMSDWQLMVKLAKQNGYSLKADNTTVVFQPLTQEFTDMRQQAALYLMSGLETKLTGIYSFKPLIGEAIPFTDAKKATVAVSGVDRETSVDHVNTNQKTIRTTRAKATAPTFDSYHTDVVAPTAKIAKYESNAADERNRYAYRGEVVIPGNPTLLPDAPIYLDGLGTTYSGYWTVLSVENYVNKEIYTTTIEVGADSLGLSAKWTDNKDILHPEQTVKRVVKPGIRQLNASPKTHLKKTGPAIKKGSSVPHSSVKNLPKVQSKILPSYKWVGTSGNLKQATVVDKKMPSVVLNKRLK